MAGTSGSSEPAASQSANRQEWSASSAVYATRTTAQARPDRLVRPLLPQDVRGWRILDAGCGTGWFSRSLAAEGATVTGVDIAEGLIERARAQEAGEPLGLTYHVLDLTEPLPFPEDSFDAAVSVFTVMDVADPIAVVRNVARVVKPGGLFAFSLVHPAFFRPRVNATGNGFDVSHYFNRDRLESRRIEAKDGSGAVTEYRQYHRTLGDYLNALAESRFCLTHFHEPGDTTLALAATKHPAGSA